MSRHKNDREYLRTIKTTRTVYSILEDGDFTTHEDDQYYKERTLSEILGVDRTRRYSSKYEDKKRKRHSKDTKTKGRCNNLAYKLSDNRFKKNGGNRTNG